MVRRSAMAAIVGVLLGGGTAGHAAQSEIADEPLGPGYRMMTSADRVSADPYQLLVLVKVEPLNGKLKVCGVYIADMSDRRFNQLQSEMIDRNSYLRFGVREERGGRLRPSFLAAKRAVVNRGPDGRPQLPLKELRANCVASDIDWEDRFASEPFQLGLRNTRFNAPRKPL